ncbi:unnamed protein product [Microthlaspi erraticum]|uniref:F-box associated beta-propeller type 3 domain-containing protein n=1 Tax=Microthlaspi erraticum TaxID=1685480 RepID=A0A6D2IQA9_9BRAS|nr:unnamed protein product [Microthlaspi erraticum]
MVVRRRIVDRFGEVFGGAAAEDRVSDVAVHSYTDIVVNFVSQLTSFDVSSVCTNVLLFACEDYSELFFFSSSQLHNPDVNLSPVAAKYHMNLPFGRVTHVRGLVCVTDKQILEARKETVRVIFNPSTRESLILPKVKTRNVTAVMITSLGYDPIDKKFKVLLSTTAEGFRKEMFEEHHQVLTLGTGTWRTIECCIPHCRVFQEICINGVIYYLAITSSGETGIHMIVCFDVRSEKFVFIKTTETSFSTSLYCGTLTNYNGKLGILFSQGRGHVCGKSRSIELWVLENSEKQEWSEHIYVLPALWENIVGNAYLDFVGVTRGNEIVMSAYYPTFPFYVFYYNIERKTVVRVEVQGMEKFKENRVHIFLDHVEDVKLMGVV